MLIGEYKNTIDDKGRISFPAKLKNKLEGQELIITCGFDGNLLIMNKVNFEIFCDTIGGERLAIFNKKARLLARKIIGPSQHIDLDKSGRFLIPPSLRSSAELAPKQEAIFVGLRDHIELWNVDRYEEEMNMADDEFSSATESKDYGISFDSGM